MSKIFNVYVKNKNGVDTDKTWYDSSNIKYSECLDPDDSLKTLKIVFTNGTAYEYSNVDTRDYLLFREDASQGRALNRIIKEGGYSYKKVENVDLNEIDDELFFRSNKGYYLCNNENGFEIRNNADAVVYKLDNQLDNGTFDMINDILKAVNINTKII